MNAPPAYRHVQIYGLLWIILLATQAFAVLFVLLQADAHLWKGLLLVSVMNAAALSTLGRLVIEVREGQLHWGFGWLGRPAWQLRLAEIVAVESLRAPRIAGSGIKGTRRHRLYNVTIGGPALQLTLADGRKVTLGTPEPERLRGFIQPRPTGLR
jgi:hypothetical protein